MQERSPSTKNYTQLGEYFKYEILYDYLAPSVNNRGEEWRKALEDVGKLKSFRKRNSINYKNGLPVKGVIDLGASNSIRDPNNPYNKAYRSIYGHLHAYYIILRENKNLPAPLCEEAVFRLIHKVQMNPFLK